MNRFFIFNEMTTKMVALYGDGPWRPRLKLRFAATVRVVDLTDAPPGALLPWLEQQVAQERDTLVVGLRNGDDVELLRSVGARVVAVSGDQPADDLDITPLMYQVPIECLLNQHAIESYVASALAVAPYEIISAQMLLLYSDAATEDAHGLVHSMYACDGTVAALVYRTEPKLTLGWVTAALAPAMWVRTTDDRGAIPLSELLSSVEIARSTAVRSLEPAVGTVVALRPRFDANGEPDPPGPAQAGALAGLISTESMSLSDLEETLADATASPWQLIDVLASSPEEAWAAAHCAAVEQRFTPRLFGSGPACGLGTRCQCTSACETAYVCVGCGPVCVACAEAAVLAHGDALAVPGAAVGAPWTVVCPGEGCSQLVWGDKLRPKLPPSVPLCRQSAP